MREAGRGARERERRNDIYNLSYLGFARGVALIPAVKVKSVNDYCLLGEIMSLPSILLSRNVTRLASLLALSFQVISKYARRFGN